MSDEPYVDPDTDRERRIRTLVERCIAPGSKVGPEYSLLSVSDAHWLLRQLDKARLWPIPHCAWDGTRSCAFLGTR